MPDKRTNRGPHPKDAELFAPDKLDTIRRALNDLCWLLSKGYARNSALKIVGDRYGLQERQRMALNRVACSEEELDLRLSKRIDPAEAAGGIVNIDGFNLITTIEAALSGGLLILCRDGCIRDLASMHGNYRKVSQTVQAIDLIGQALQDLRIGKSSLVSRQACFKQWKTENDSHRGGSIERVGLGNRCGLQSGQRTEEIP